MNWQHFRAFLWLRWRIRANHFRRAGTANAILTMILLPLGILLALVLFVALFLVGLLALRETTPAVIMYVWDGLVLAFLLWWGTGLITDLQRSDALSLDKFLHLPVSLKGVFLVNYLSSLISVNMVVFLPAMLGLSLALVLARGPAMLMSFPLVTAFFLMVSAVTHQFQGWLATLMVNKRRRRTIIVVLTMVFVSLFQLPNLVHLVVPGQSRPFGDHREESTPLSAEQEQQIEQIVWLANAVLPVGWLPLGAGAAAGGDVLVGTLAIAGMTCIGMASLWRSYRTTVKLYSGHYTAGKSSTAAVSVPAKAGPVAVGLLERHLPWLPEQTTAIALAGFRSMMRAPEAKLMLLTPIILVVVTTSLFFTNRFEPPAAVRPLLALGGMATTLLGMMQLIGNQFGFDRSGFRVYVLCAARRRDILLGKNLALAPLALGLGMFIAVVVQVIFPMRVDHFLACLAQLVTMYLLVCLLANLLSMFGPMPIAAGSLKPVDPKLVPILLQLVFLGLMPLVIVPTALPLLVELLVSYLTGMDELPICFLLSVLECVAVVCVYNLGLTWEGAILQMREQRILEVVTTKAE